MARLLFLAPLFAVIAVVFYLVFLKSPPPLPDLDYNEWWGPQELKSKVDDKVTPFKIEFKPELIQDLKQRLKSVRPLTPALEDIAFQYGFNSKQLGGWIKYWAEEYPFAERQKFLNQYPGYKTYIQGLNIHFLHVKPKKVPAGVEVVPVLLLHGWPGSIREFYEVLPLLTTYKEGDEFAVEAIVPALPGYGYSDPAVRPGMGPAQIAVIFRNLMHRLGYKQFYVQGGDWGSLIGSNMVTLFPKEVLGFHVNSGFSTAPVSTALTVLGSIFPSLIVEPALADRMYPLSVKYSFLIEESGYMHIQSTKPDTVGIGLTDSPAGLLAYILEKFSSWTNKDYRSLPDGGLTKYFTKEQLIDNLMFYWAPNSITTSMRLYSEGFTSRQTSYRMDEIPTPVPTWVLQAKHELTYLPPFLLKFKYPNLVGSPTLEDGGHFLAFQLPKEFTSDVKEALVAFKKWHKSNSKTEL